MAGQLRRSATNQQISGVCAGLAEYLGVDATVVRLATVLLALFTSAPVIIAYIIGALVLPEGENAPPSVAVDWEADGLRVSWSGPTLPFAVSWAAAIGAVAACGVAVAALGGLASLAGIDLFGMVGAWTSWWPAALLVAAGGLLPRPYALTVTHGALWVERPLREPRRIDLAEVETVRRGPDGMVVLLGSGELLKLPAPPPDVALDAFQEQVASARRRALGHRVDLEQAEAERRQLQAILAAREER